MRPRVTFLSLTACLVLLFATCLFVGSVHIPAASVWSILTGGMVENDVWSFIILETRLPAAITAVLCGAALAVSGLLLQTAFRNPLAGPGIFGITNGAALGVALVMLFWGGALTVPAFSLPFSSGWESGSGLSATETFTLSIRCKSLILRKFRSVQTSSYVTTSRCYTPTLNIPLSAISKRCIRNNLSARTRRAAFVA